MLDDKDVMLRMIEKRREIIAEMVTDDDRGPSEREYFAATVSAYLATASTASETEEAVETKFRRGDRVYKPTGYEWPGEVVWVGPLEGTVHYIVARDQEDPDRRRALHIFSEKQIALRDAPITTEGE